MAKAAGAVTCGELGLDAYYAYTKDRVGHVYIPFRIVPSPKGLTNDDAAGKYCKLKYVYRQWADTLLTDVIHEDFYATKIDLLAQDEWNASITTPTYRAIPWDTENFSYLEGTEFTGANRVEGANRYELFQYSIYKTVNDNTQPHCASIYIETEFDSTYDERVELIERDDSADRIYQPDMFFSAYHWMCCTVKTLNRILYETRPRFTCPLFGYFPNQGGVT
jgi:hypothetical protein